MRQVAPSSQPTADRTQLSCPPSPDARQMQSGPHCSPCTPPRSGSVCGGSAGSMLTPNSATKRGERFALRCGSVHAPVPLRSAEVQTACRGQWGTVCVSRAEPTACSPNPATVRGEPEHRQHPGQPGAQAARAHATAAQPVPRPGCTALALRALLTARQPHSYGLLLLHHRATV